MNESIKKMYEQEPKTWYAKIIVALIVAALLLLRVVEAVAAPALSAREACSRSSSSNSATLRLAALAALVVPLASLAWALAALLALTAAAAVCCSNFATGMAENAAFTLRLIFFRAVRRPFSGCCAVWVVVCVDRAT